MSVSVCVRVRLFFSVPLSLSLFVSLSLSLTVSLSDCLSVRLSPSVCGGHGLLRTQADGPLFRAQRDSTPAMFSREQKWPLIMGCRRA